MSVAPGHANSSYVPPPVVVPSAPQVLPSSEGGPNVVSNIVI